MLKLAALFMASSMVVGQAEGPNYVHLKPLEGIVGQWKMTGQWEDGRPFSGEESSEWFLNRNFIHSRGWFSGYDGQRVNYNIVTGWNPESQKIVVWFAVSDGSHCMRVGTVDPATKLWTCTENGVDAAGRPYSFDLAIHFVDQNTLTWKGTNFHGPEPRPDLDITFTRVAPSASDAHQQWIKYLAGKWTTSDQDGVAYDDVLELTGGGRALQGQGKFADGIEYSRQLGWHADSATLVETWYLSNGVCLVNRYRQIDERKIVGSTMIADETGRTAEGTIVRQKVGEEEIKSTYRGNVPGEDGEVSATWISKRK
jgi:hypothetical protein